MKKHPLLNLFLLVAVCVFASSCKNMYIPNMHNVPMLQEKNEFRATASAYNYQTAYAVSNHIGVLANGYYRPSNWTITSGDLENEYKSDRFLLEGGMGYFGKIDEGVVADCYGGGGFGNVEYNWDLYDQGVLDDEQRLSANMTRFFVQPSIGYTIDFVDVAFSTRFAALKFNNLKTVNYTTEELIAQNLYKIDQPLYLFLEPAFTLRFGFKYIKFHLQTIYSGKLNSEPLNYKFVVVNTGIHINIAGRFKNE